jgi:hypothetical protein
MTVCGRPSTVMDRPTRAGSAPNRRRQNPSLRTTTLGGTASEGTNVRPAIGVTPSRSKNRALTIWVVTCSALPSGSLTATLFERNAAIISNDWF